MKWRNAIHDITKALDDPAAAGKIDDIIAAKTNVRKATKPPKYKVGDSVQTHFAAWPNTQVTQHTIQRIWTCEEGYKGHSEYAYHLLPEVRGSRPCHWIKDGSHQQPNHTGVINMADKNQSVEQMRNQFFIDLLQPYQDDIFIPTAWEEIPETEKTAWINALEYAYKCGYNKGGDDTHAAQAKAFANAETGTHYDHLD